MSYVRAGNGAAAGSNVYLTSENASEQGLCVVRRFSDRRGVLNLVGRSVQNSARAEHASLQAQLIPFAPGKSAQTYVNLNEQYSQRSMQYQVTLSVLREEQITVPAGVFDTFVLEERDRNLSCIAIYQAWLDKRTMLPVKIHRETLGCTGPVEFDTVASRVVSGAAGVQGTVARPSGN